MRQLNGLRSAWVDFRSRTVVPFEYEDHAKAAFYAGAAWAASRLLTEAKKTLDIAVDKLCDQKK